MFFKTLPLGLRLSSQYVLRRESMGNLTDVQHRPREEECGNRLGENYKS